MSKKTEQVQVAQESKPGFIKYFGKIFAEYGSQGKKIVQEKMLEVFPEKSETILKWADWYKAYYNMGKIPGFENPVKISWRKVKEQKA